MSEESGSRSRPTQRLRSTSSSKKEHFGARLTPSSPSVAPTLKAVSHRSVSGPPSTTPQGDTITRRSKAVSKREQDVNGSVSLRPDLVQAGPSRLSPLKKTASTQNTVASTHQSQHPFARTPEPPPTKMVSHDWHHYSPNGSKSKRSSKGSSGAARSQSTRSEASSNATTDVTTSSTGVLPSLERSGSTVSTAPTSPDTEPMNTYSVNTTSGKAEVLDGEDDE